MRSIVITGVLDLVVLAAEDEDTKEMLGVVVVKPPGIVDRARWASRELLHEQELIPSANANGPHADVVETLLEQTPSIVADSKVLRSHVRAVEREAWGPNDVTDIWFISFIGVLDSARGPRRTLCEAAADAAGGNLGLVAIGVEGVSACFLFKAGKG
jgi:hypothetical protein